MLRDGELMVVLHSAAAGVARPNVYYFLRIPDAAYEVCVVIATHAGACSKLNGPTLRTRVADKGPKATLAAMLQNLPQKRLRFRVLRVVEELVRRGFFKYLTFRHKDHAICYAAGKTHFVGNAEHGHAVFGKADHGV